MNHVVNGAFPKILPGVDVIPKFFWVGAAVVGYVSSGCMFNFNRVCLLVRNGEQIRHYVMVDRDHLQLVAASLVLRLARASDGDISSRVQTHRYHNSISRQNSLHRKESHRCQI